MDEKYFVAKVQYDLIDKNSGKPKKSVKKSLLEDLVLQMCKLS